VTADANRQQESDGQKAQDAQTQHFLQLCHATACSAARHAAIVTACLPLS
jgi:hypothetical protein